MEWYHNGIGCMRGKNTRREITPQGKIRGVKKKEVAPSTIN